MMIGLVNQEILLEERSLETNVRLWSEGERMQ